MELTDAERLGDKINKLLATQGMLFERNRRIAAHAEILADQVGTGALLANVRFGFMRLAAMARGEP